MTSRLFEIFDFSQRKACSLLFLNAKIAEGGNGFVNTLGVAFFQFFVILSIFSGVSMI